MQKNRRFQLMAIVTSLFFYLNTQAAESNGVFRLKDDAQLFTPEGATVARKLFESATFSQPTHLTIFTVKQIPSEKETEFQRVAKNPAERARFFEEWARSLAKSERETGIFVLMFDDGTKYITQAIADQKMSRDRGFQTAQLNELIKILNEGSQAALKQPVAIAQQRRDESLEKAVRFVIDRLKSSQGGGGSTAAGKPELPAGIDQAAAQASPWLSWLCLGLVVLLGVWMVIGLIRMITGGMGGMGGGGFFSSLLGGLFGAAAGMYLYDQFFGSGASSASAAQGSGDTTGTDAGAGDWDRGSAGGGYDAGGGDWGGGDLGGGDFGGGDW